MAVYVIIPARYGSKRFPGKPLVSIKGRPMIQHVMERAGRARDVAGVWVATDDERIAEAVRAFGGEVVMTSPELRSGSDRVAAAAEILGIGDEHIVVNVQGDQPLLPAEVIDLTVAAITGEPGVDMATPVIRFTNPEEIDDPDNVKVVMDARGNALYFSRAVVPYPREEALATYYKHLGIYAFTRPFLATFARLPSGVLESTEKLEQLRVLEAGYQIRCVISPWDSPEVDRPEDAREVEELLG